MVGGGPSGAKLLQILNVRVVGSGERVVVLSHGLGTDQSVWSRVLPCLTRDHRVVLYDLACAGSVNPDHFDFGRYNGLDAYVDDLLSILDALTIPRCALVGHSVSAMIGILASIRRPELFAKLVLIGCSPCFQNDGDYHGGFEAEEVQEVFDAMSANYMAWATGYAPLAVGADVPEAVQEFSRTLFNVRPDISLHVCRSVFKTDLRARRARHGEGAVRRRADGPRHLHPGHRRHLPEGPPRRPHHRRAPAHGGAPAPSQRPQPPRPGASPRARSPLVL
jgi:pimeloyl-ACP methyl ester carboxylesterase